MSMNPITGAQIEHGRAICAHINPAIEPILSHPGANNRRHNHRTDELDHAGNYPSGLFVPGQLVEERFHNRHEEFGIGAADLYLTSIV